MMRALALATHGEGKVSPNPMVGAVIVHDGRIIGEGFHNFYGGPHAEVNAINSVRDEDRELLKDSTIYVTLEPCAHHGKTPPCAHLIVKTGIPRVVIGSRDPNPLVAGKGIQILKDAGIQVETGILEDKCMALNPAFMASQVSDRPRVILKWAQSADGFMAATDSDGNPFPVKFSSPLSSVWMHRKRSEADVIMVGHNTERIDNPKLNVRYWGGNSPKKIVAEGNIDILQTLKALRKEGATSVMVEGGPTLLKSFIDQGIFDEIRVEICPIELWKGLEAPELPKGLTLCSAERCRENEILTYKGLDVKKK